MSEPSIIFQDSETNLTLIYPQALHKQKFGNKKMNLKTDDMVIKFDAHFNFYFPMDYHKDQSPCGFDFMKILTHEVLHGLGVYSSLKELNPHLISPQQAIRNIKARNVTVYENDFLITLFDRNVVAGKTNLSFVSFAKQLRDFGPIVTDDNQDLELIIYNYPHHRVLKGLYEASKNQLYFRTLTNQKVPLVPSSFFSFKPPSHLDESTYANTKDESMVAGSFSGTGLHELFNRDERWTTSPFGPAALEILATLGYKLNPNPSYEDSLQSFYAQYRKLPHDQTDSFLFRISPWKYFCLHMVF
ncbi:hypothetical protein DSO57_1003870 [Entomophthora muscae]|uniref:Uncharacterized protein n=1 Tax=Entomophthora muscae TaxID=34485 RepID=A0ACC2RN69_9FUNG|nr:hypothetical protein DSO57_1003870 [Entomophthora muscae]